MHPFLSYNWTIKEKDVKSTYLYNIYTICEQIKFVLRISSKCKKSELDYQGEI